MFVTVHPEERENCTQVLFPSVERNEIIDSCVSYTLYYCALYVAEVCVLLLCAPTCVIICKAMRPVMILPSNS